MQHTPLVTVKAAMTLDGKIATAKGESKWITGSAARRHGHFLRKGSDAVLVGVNTVIADDPSLRAKGKLRSKPLGRIILDSSARTPLGSKVLNDDQSIVTTIVVTRAAPLKRVLALEKKANVLPAPARKGRVDLRWLLEHLGQHEIISLLVEGGGDVNASFLKSRLGHRVAFYYAPKVIGGGQARRAVSGNGVKNLSEALRLEDAHWGQVGSDLLLTGKVSGD